MSTAVTSSNELTSYAQKWAEHIVFNICAYEQKRLGRWFSDILEENNALGGHPYGFVFAGNFMGIEDATAEDRALFRELPEEMRENVNNYRIAKAAFDDEKQRMEQGFVTLVYGCSLLKDVREALPDHLHKVAIIPGADAERTRPPAWTLQDNPIKLYEYDQLMELCDIYLSSRML